MAMPQVAPWDRADIDRLPDDGNRYEVLDGELLVTPAPSDVHQHFVDWLNAVLTPFVAAHDLGYVQQPHSVVVVGRSQVEPDLMVRARAPRLGWERAPIPMLIVEVLSKSTMQRDLGTKRDFYARSGIEEYWVVDRWDRSIRRITRRGEERIEGTLRWAPPGITATLNIDVASMFDEVLGPR